MAMQCFTNWYYIPIRQPAKAKGLLTYLQYRDDRDTHIPRAGGPDRWVDCGLGGNWREILNNLTELECQKTNMLLRSLVIRPPQAMIAELEQSDPARWADRRERMHELVERVMADEMARRGIEWPGGRQAMDLPYSYVIHAPDDKNGVESLHAHVIVPAMDRDRLGPFNVYPKDVQQTRAVAEREVDRLFGLERDRDLERDGLQRDRELPGELDLDRDGPGLDVDLDLEIDFFGM
ncbi:MAG: hypothetical protein JXA93_07745 [Anaerolineae bacterium]|nr:hypothetical protein [Anaerolineae bacterium]